jgi:signal transduction histidine kinase
VTAPTDPLATLARWSLYFRLALVALASLAVAVGADPDPLLPVILVAAMAVNLVPLLWWTRFGPWIGRHPLVLIVDLVLTSGLLLLTGVDGPFLFYTLGTVFLGGVVYGSAGGALYSAMVVGGYLLVAGLRAPLEAQPLGFQQVVAMPVLLVLVAIGAASIRRLLAERAEAERIARREEADAAISADRARLARELHDSVAKTMHGIALQAAGLERHVRSDVDRAAREAAAIGRTCERAARESRELLMALRSQRLDVPIDEAVAELADGWSQRTGVAVHADLEALPTTGPDVRHELLRIVDEALRNAERHADATLVTVTLRAEGEAIRLAIADDGNGLPSQPDLERLAAEGHYGLQGITERAARIGGDASVTTTAGRGLTIDVRTPAVVAETDPLQIARDHQRGRGDT